MKKLITLLIACALMLAPAAAFAENTAETEASEIPQMSEAVEETEETEVPPEAETAELTAETEADDITSAPADELIEAPAPVVEIPKEVTVTYDGIRVNLYPAPYIDDGVTMVPIRALAECIGFDVRYDADYNTEVLSLGLNYIFYNVNTNYTTAFGTDLYALRPTIQKDGTVFVAIRTFADIIGSELTFDDYGSYANINLANSTYVNDYFRSQPVNPWGIDSRTKYMVWVSKSEYTVRMYMGEQYKWKLIHECPCAIGAPGTPTVTGSFEYQYKTQWNYNGYYVGPCLVFYRGYALHSVLLRYDNTEYDGRTGVMISHGCVRMKKYDIDLIANTIPVGTRIYVTD